MKKIGLIGVGNPFMGDDGIGPLLIEQMHASEIMFDDRVHLIDGGTGGMFLVHALARLAAAVIVDAADFGGMAGEYRIVSARKLWLRRHPPVSVKSFSGFSVHEWDLLKTIELSIMMHELPHPFYIMIIQPRSIAPRSGLSSVLQVRLPHYEKVLCRLLTSLLAGPCGHRNDG